MKKIYHISLSSHEDVLFRNDRDFAIGFNCLAEAAFVTDSKLLADGLMSTHWHSIVLADDPQGFVHRKRYAYARFFNAMYGRTQDRRTLLGQAALCGKTASEAQLRRCLVLPRRHAE